VHLVSTVSRCRSRAIILHARNGAMPRVCARAARLVTLKVAGQSDQLPFTSPCSCRRIQIIILYDSVQDVERDQQAGHGAHGEGGYGYAEATSVDSLWVYSPEVSARYHPATPITRSFARATSNIPSSPLALPLARTLNGWSASSSSCFPIQLGSAGRHSLRPRPGRLP